jgi:hypothetical protein
MYQFITRVFVSTGTVIKCCQALLVQGRAIPLTQHVGGRLTGELKVANAIPTPEEDACDVGIGMTLTRAALHAAACSVGSGGETVEYDSHELYRVSVVLL